MIDRTYAAAVALRELQANADVVYIVGHEPRTLGDIAERIAGALEEAEAFAAVDIEKQAQQDAAAAHDLVDAIITALRDPHDDTRARHTDVPVELLARQALEALDADRERTGVDEWDESDHRCELYNLAAEVLGL